MKVLTIAHLTFLEARQRRLLWIIFLIGLLFLGLFALGFYFMYEEVSGGISRGSSADPTLITDEFSNVMLLMGLYGVNSLGVLLAVLLAVSTIAGEIASGTIQTIVTKPLRRWEVVLGKWLGLAVMLAAVILFLSAGLMAIVWLIAGYLPPNLVQGVGLMILEGLIFLALTILGGTRLSVLGNGVVMFMLYGMTFVAGWVEQIGALLQNEAAVNVGIVASLVVPGEAMWRRAAYLMQTPILRELSVTPFSTASAPNNAMVAYAAGYVVIVLGIAALSFRGRDL